MITLRPIATNMQRSDVVMRAIAHMEQTFAAPFSLSRFAGILDISPRRLRNLFKQQLGRSPSEFVISLRIEKAKELLRAGIPIKRVAVDVGFVDQAHLTRHFKRAIGLTPARYLRKKSPRGR